jgi:hypothetical protein
MADILKICPYCGNEYASWALGCCGESTDHGVYVIDDDDDQTQYDTYKEADKALDARDLANKETTQ